MRAALVAAAASLALALPLPAAAQAAACPAPDPIDADLAPTSGVLPVVFYSPKASVDAALRRLLPKDLPGARVGEAPTSADYKQPVVVSKRPADLAKEFPPPALDSLQYFGRSLSREEAVALSQAKTGHFIVFFLPRADMWKLYRAANAMVPAIAEETGSLLWDLETREAFTAASWKRLRVDGWQDGPPDMTRHYTIHLYRNNDYLRAITLGLGKFGLPDIVVPELSQSDNSAVASTINLLAQRMAEGGVKVRAGAFDLRLADVRDPAERERVRKTLKAGATGEAPLCLHAAKPEPGDPDNLLMAIAFDRAKGNDTHARRAALLTRAFGIEAAPVLSASRDQELLQASARARSRVPELKTAFAKGLAPGEKLTLKLPFSNSPGAAVEYMWVEVGRWKDDGTISGLLMSQPRFVKRLQTGQEITVRESDIYDYLRVYPDGREEGNETGRILQAREKARGR